MKKILDTSVITKWFFNESGSEEALRMLNEFKTGKISIVVPNLIFYELGNVLKYKGVEVDLSGKIIQALNDLGLQVENTGQESFRKTYQNCLEYGITFYDSSFLTLMQKYDGHLLTADQKLFNKLNDKFTNISLLS